MEEMYHCRKCQMLFVEPLDIKGVFVCPKCKSPEFDVVKVNK